MGIILVKNLSKNFYKGGKQLLVLDDISFSVEAGQILAILGKSGSGKTTILNIISKLETPSSGEVEYEGSVSYVPQNDLLLPWRNVIENIELPFEIKGSQSVEDKALIEMLLREMELTEFTKSYPHELSGGMKQKVSLVRSLAQNNPLCIFDEALSAIDFDTRIKLVKKIREHILKEKKIGIFVTHNIDEAISIADKVIVISSIPAKVVYQADINISEDFRDPIAVRKHPEFQNKFDCLWKLMAQI